MQYRRLYPSGKFIVRRQTVKETVSLEVLDEHEQCRAICFEPTEAMCEIVDEDFLHKEMHHHPVRTNVWPCFWTHMFGCVQIVKGLAGERRMVLKTNEVGTYMFCHSLSKTDI